MEKWETASARCPGRESEWVAKWNEGSPTCLPNGESKEAECELEWSGELASESATGAVGAQHALTLRARLTLSGVNLDTVLSQVAVCECAPVHRPWNNYFVHPLKQLQLLGSSFKYSQFLKFRGGWFSGSLQESKSRVSPHVIHGLRQIEKWIADAGTYVNKVRRQH